MSDETDSARAAQEQLRGHIAKLAEITSQPNFLRMLQEVQEASPEERLATATRLATVEGLRGRGIEVPPELRITTRYFENPEAPLRADVLISRDDPPEEPEAIENDPTVCCSVGYFVCVSAGDAIDLGAWLLPEEELIA